MEGPKVGRFGKVGAEENLTKIVTDGVTTEGRFCKSIMKGVSRRKRQRHAMFAEMEEENQDVVCVDNITGKDLPWHALRKARAPELKFLRDFRVHEKVDEREAIAQYQLTLFDTTWTDTDKAFEESPCEQNQELLRENLRVTIDQICMQGLLHWKR